MKLPQHDMWAFADIGCPACVAAWVGFEDCSVSLLFVVQHVRMGKVHMQWLFGSQCLSPFQSTRKFPTAWNHHGCHLQSADSLVLSFASEESPKKFWNENGKGREMETQPRCNLTSSSNLDINESYFLMWTLGTREKQKLDAFQDISSFSVPGRCFFPRQAHFALNRTPRGGNSPGSL